MGRAMGGLPGLGALAQGLALALATGAPTASWAMDLGDVAAPRSGRVEVRFETYKGLPMLAMTGAEWHRSSEEGALATTRDRAKGICEAFGFAGLADFRVEADDRAGEYAAFEGGTFVTRHEEGDVELVYGLGVLTAMVGVPLWTNPRRYEYVSCWRQAEGGGGR